MPPDDPRRARDMTAEEFRAARARIEADEYAAARRAADAAAMAELRRKYPERAPAQPGTKE